MAALVAAGVAEALARERVGDRFDAAEQRVAEAGTCRVLRGNWLALRVWMALSRQWRQLPMGGLAGLDNAAIPATLTLMGVKRREWPALFEQLQAMEGAALEVIRARQ